MSKKMKNLPDGLSIQIIVNGELYNVNKIAGFKLEDKRTLSGGKLTSHVSIDLTAEASKELIQGRPELVPLIEDGCLPPVGNIMPTPKMRPPGSTKLVNKIIGTDLVSSDAPKQSTTDGKEQTNG